MRKHLPSIIVGLVASLVTTALIAATALPGVNSTLNTVFTYSYEISSDKPTYSATSGLFAPASSATDVCQLQGSATKLIRVRRIFVQGTSSGAGSGMEPMQIQFHTQEDASSNGTAMIQPSLEPYDPNSATATASMEAYTVNPNQAIGSTEYTLVYSQLPYFAESAAGLNTGYPGFVFEPGRYGQAFILRNSLQTITVNLTGVSAPSGGLLNCTFEWTEE